MGQHKSDWLLQHGASFVPELSRDSLKQLVNIPFSRWAEEGLLGEGEACDGEKLLGIDGLVAGDEVFA